MLLKMCLLWLWMWLWLRIEEGVCCVVMDDGSIVVSRRWFWSTRQPLPVLTRSCPFLPLRVRSWSFLTVPDHSCRS